MSSKWNQAKRRVFLDINRKLGKRWEKEKILLRLRPIYPKLKALRIALEALKGNRNFRHHQDCLARAVCIRVSEWPLRRMTTAFRAIITSAATSSSSRLVHLADRLAASTRKLIIRDLPYLASVLQRRKVEFANINYRLSAALQIWVR
jgi:hypothetical protein